MAKPRYIICCQDRLIDRATGLASHINVIDSIVVSETKHVAAEGVAVFIPPIPIAQLMMTCVWSRTEGDGDKEEFDCEVILHKPDGEVKTIQSLAFCFGTKRFFRVDAGLIFTTQTRFKESGELVVECRLKKQGTEQWLSQSFPLGIEVIPAESIGVSENVTESANQ